MPFSGFCHRIKKNARAGRALVQHSAADKWLWLAVWRDRASDKIDAFGIGREQGACRRGPEQGWMDDSSYTMSTLSSAGTDDKMEFFCFLIFLI
jgi:hypothetical protein